MPTSAFIIAAGQPGARPIYVLQFPVEGIYLASDPGHYPIGFAPGADEPHHAEFTADGLPSVKYELPGRYYGRVTPALADIRLPDDGSYDSYFSGYLTTLVGAQVYGYITYPGLASSDALKFLSGRVQKTISADTGDFTVNLGNDIAGTLNNAKVPALSYTSQKLGTLVKNILTGAGLTYPTDFNTTAWDAWTAAGMPGDYTATGQYSEGALWSTIDSLLTNTLSVYFINRAGKFHIETFADLGGSPTADIDLDDTDCVFAGENRMETFETVLRRVSVQYAVEFSPIVKTTTPSSKADCWNYMAQDLPMINIGLAGSSSDATSLCTKIINLLSVPHAITAIHTDARMMGYEVLQTVKLTMASVKLPAISTQYHRIIGIEEDPRRGGVILTLWSKLGDGPTIS